MTTRKTTAPIAFVAILLRPSLRYAQEPQPKGGPKLTEVWEHWSHHPDPDVCAASRNGWLVQRN